MRLFYVEGINIWVFPKIGIPQNGWFVMENPIKMNDLGVPLFLETSILILCYTWAHFEDHEGTLQKGIFWVWNYQVCCVHNLNMLHYLYTSLVDIVTYTSYGSQYS